MLRQIILHGDLAARFGGPFRLDVVNADEAARAFSLATAALLFSP